MKFLSNTCLKLSHLSLFFSSLEEDPLYIAYADMMAKVTHSPPWVDRLLMCEALQVPVFCFRAVLKVKKRRKERRRHSR